MGNIFQCCSSLSNYFKHHDAQGGSEQSRLLSSEESECDSLSLTYNLEDDLFTVSTGVTNPVLQPEHFLFPDIILSSNPGGEVTLVEPMVCLLVSEEEEGLGGNEPGGEGLRSSMEGGDWDYSEVETQTEAETQIGTEVETQTEVQMQTETLQSNKETLETSTLTNTKNEIDEQEEGQRWVNLLFEAKREPQTPRDRNPEIDNKLRMKKKSINSEFWANADGSIEEKLPGRAESKNTHNTYKTTSTHENMELQEDIEVLEMQQHPGPTPPNEKSIEQNSESISVVLMEHKETNADENNTSETQKMIKHNSSDTGLHFHPVEC